ncbi:MAG: DNA repair protein RecN [Prolixibacteraceae bacterium]|nr:DNA repair protein RecN [Prolixibacteraceae bacterium]
MLQHLYISNYALIDNLSIDFYSGFNIITGETGAGKSIILGAIGLIMGQRANSGVLQDKKKKCIVEGSFVIKGYGLEELFNHEDVDYDDQTILRREITPSGKSRAFINDTPVSIKTIQIISGKLIDIHSQHKNLELGNHLFQLNVVDSVANNNQFLEQYNIAYKKWEETYKKIEVLSEKRVHEKASFEYLNFKYQELNEAKLQPDEQENLEIEQKQLGHAEEIKLTLGQLSDFMENNDNSLLSELKENISSIGNMMEFLPSLKEIKDRLESCYIELKDITGECYSIAEQTEDDPQRMRLVEERLNLIYSLQQKYKVVTVQGLIDLRDEAFSKLEQVNSYDSQIALLKKELYELYSDLINRAEEISKRRKEVADKICKSVVDVLKRLSIIHASFKIDFQRMDKPGPCGIDDLQFLFSANKNSDLNEISKIASGGEISRVMLAIKSLITDSKSLPTIIFDEIDTGISGEVAVNMGTILKDMSVNMQIINITHLPQIAGKGEHHFKVFKKDDDRRTYTSIRELSQEERIEELAQMLGGKGALTEAMETARKLLNL